jgi:type IV pilus assembly protein PilY1
MALLNRKQLRPRTGALARGLLATLLALCAGNAIAQDDEDEPLVSQLPLSAGGNVPGNVVLTPSVEYPTVNSKANIGAFNSASTYYGYFDPHKCYTYVWDALEANRHFAPSRDLGSPALCSNVSMEWSGNWLNWATTQTIDGFRKALTGGLRVRDTTTETWLEKARHDGQGGAGYFPNASIAGNAALIQQVIPAPTAGGWASLTARIWGGGSQLFLNGASRVCAGIDTMSVGYPGPTPVAHVVNIQVPATPQVVDYNPAVHVFDSTDTGLDLDCDAGGAVNNRDITNANRIYRLSMRVKVCVTGMLEDNCVAYTGGVAKPEGLVQQYQRKMRFSVFGYLVDNFMYRDGGVLRASQKFVGPEMLDADTGEWVDNPNKEWSATTGIFEVNPDPTDADDTETAANLGGIQIENSGVINYINKFAQNPSIGPKTFDPVSEMYYAATRYLRGLDPVSTYNDLTRTMNNNAGGTVLGAAFDRWRLTDNFPVITDWANNDPYQHWCQNTAIIGIGDVYTHRDKNLPGRESGSEEPALPAEVANDPDFTGAGKMSVIQWTRRVWDLEDLAVPAWSGNFEYTIPLGGLNASGYIAGLSYFAHTQDIRADLQNKQFVSTHWVDVREVQRVEPRERNQYWMAAKYGGFLVPSSGFDSMTHVTAFPDSWWASGDLLNSNPQTPATYQDEDGFGRPSNYYLGDRPDTMIAGLTRAFAKFGSDAKGSGASLAANSTRLDTTTLTFQAQFQNSIWMGELNAFKVIPTTGALETTPLWTASSKVPAWGDRRIFVNSKDAGVNDMDPFEWGNLTAAQQAAFNALWTGVPMGTTGEHVLQYIRGDQSREEAAGGGFRTRTAPAGWSHKLGDIVNSTPVYVGAPNPALYAQSSATWEGRATHAQFAQDNEDRMAVVWVGGNDGMLHAFNANINADGTAPNVPPAVAGGLGNIAGEEVFAFIPNLAIETGLGQFANPNYQHKYFVDGDIAVADVYDTGDDEWKTVLVATMGRGGPGIFALDVTDPTAPQLLWELGADEIDGLGHNIGRPVIAQVANGDWRVVFGNGPDNANGEARLVLIEVFDGDVSSIEVDAGPANGLSAALVRDSNADGISDTIYAGDLEGQLWKITDFTGDPADADAMVLFNAVDGGGDPQPITAAPLVGRDSSTSRTWVFFGTGKYLNEDDIVDTQQQSWYGIQDTNVAVTRGQLVERQLTDGGPIGPAPAAGVEDTRFLARTLEEATAGDMDTASGWVIDLPVTRERMVVPNRFQGIALVGTSRIPDASDACRPSGRGYIMAINPFSGARLTQTFFDANRDNEFGDEDLLGDDIISGLGINSSPNNPIFIENVMQFSKDDGTTDSVRVQGANAEARRASWREITR